MIRSFCFLLFALWFAGCQKAVTPINKFSDPVMIRIADLCDRRVSDSLYLFFHHERADYRYEAALAFGSIQDSLAVEKLRDVVLNDADSSTRLAAAFALGQTSSSKSGAFLEEAFSKERNPAVKNIILEAYGKVARDWKPLAQAGDVTSETGLAWSLYRAGLNNQVQETFYPLAATLLASTHAESARLGAAHFFARGVKNPEPFFKILSAAAQSDASTDVRMACVLALRKIKTDSSLSVVQAILKSADDYRVKVNAVRALSGFPIEKTKETLFKLVRDKNENVAIAASEAVRSTITESQWIDAGNLVDQVQSWRVQATLYDAVLRVKKNPSVINEIKTKYAGSTNVYQKAALLTALQQVPDAYAFIEHELLSADTAVIRSSAASALAAIITGEKPDLSLKKKFAATAANAMKMDDAAVIGILAGPLADSTYGFRDVIHDFGFLRSARQKLSLPKDNESVQPLEAALAYFEKRKATEVKNEYNHAIDWSLVKQIPREQRAIIQTSRGSITLNLFVDEAPGSVANFVTLARRHYFDHKFFHRVVPNFVIQAGCNRGDGYGSEDYSIRSEFSLHKYTIGSVGMASAGKDTEGTQWFITHSPTPHLDGRYTVFAEVTSGIDVVHHIGIGDEIISVTIEEIKIPKN